MAKGRIMVGVFALALVIASMGLGIRYIMGNDDTEIPVDGDYDHEPDDEEPITTTATTEPYKTTTVDPYLRIKISGSAYLLGPDGEIIESYVLQDVVEPAKEVVTWRFKMTVTVESNYVNWDTVQVKYLVLMKIDAKEVTIATTFPIAAHTKPAKDFQSATQPDQVMISHSWHPEGIIEGSLEEAFVLWGNGGIIPHQIIANGGGGVEAKAVQFTFKVLVGGKNLQGEDITPVYCTVGFLTFLYRADDGKIICPNPIQEIPSGGGSIGGR